jgi:hypothetical protein
VCDEESAVPIVTQKADPSVARGDLGMTTLGRLYRGFRLNRYCRQTAV